MGSRVYLWINKRLTNGDLDLFAELLDLLLRMQQEVGEGRARRDSRILQPGISKGGWGPGGDRKFASISPIETAVGKT